MPVTPPKHGNISTSFRCGRQALNTNAAPSLDHYYRLFAAIARPAPIAIIALLAVLLHSAWHSPFGVVLAVLGGFALVHYGFAVLRRFAAGQAQAPSLRALIPVQDAELSGLGAGVFAAVGVVAYGLDQLGLKLVVMLLIPILCVYLPAVIMLLGATHNLRAALHPAEIWTLIRALGRPYAWVAVIVALSWAMSGLVLAWTIGDSTTHWALLPLTVVGLFLPIFSFAVMGDVLYQHRYTLGLDISPTDSESAPVEVSALYDELMGRGDLDAALRELQATIAEQPDNLALRDKLHWLSGKLGLADKQRRNTEQLIELALEQGRGRIARLAYTRYLAISPKFRPRKAETYLPLARALREAKQPKRAINLAHQFHKRFDAKDVTIALYFETARALSEDLGQDEKALGILHFLDRYAPGHPHIDPVREYAVILENTLHGAESF